MQNKRYLRWLILCALVWPTWCFANTNESTASGVGKAIGMALFGYLVMRFANRNKDEAQDTGTRRRVLMGALIFMAMFAVYYKSTRP